MTKAIKYLTILHIMFILLYSLSGSVPGVGGYVIYLASFALPLFFGIYLAGRLKAEREAEKDCAEESKRLFKPSGGVFLHLAPLVLPTVTLIFFFAFLSSLLLRILGITDSEVLDTGLVRMLIEHALLPAVSEELVFRFLPMILLLPYGKRSYILISALYFSLCHLNIVRMPYAFLAGLIFASVNAVFDSMYPSLILHLLNNAASVIWIRIYGDVASMRLFVIILVALSLISSVFIVLNRRRYKESVRALFDKPAPHKAQKEIFLMIAFTLILAITEMFL